MTSGEDTDGDRRPAGADGVGSDSNKANWEGSSSGAWVTVVLDPVALGLPADWVLSRKNGLPPPRARAPRPTSSTPWGARCFGA